MKRLALSSHPLAAETAEAVLGEGKSALQAALAGFFAAAGESAGVLFSPMGLLAGGVGQGLRAFDGRCRQPGLEQKRPRGTLRGEETPEAARAAVPGSLAACAVALVYYGGGTLLSCARPGIAHAKKLGATARATNLELLTGLGAAGLKHPAFQRALLSYVGPIEGGNVSSADFEGRIPPDSEPSMDEAGIVRPSWCEPSAASIEGGAAHGLVTVDPSGFFVALQFHDYPAGAEVRELGVGLPRIAEPVRRGVTRVPPGTPIQVPMDLKLRSEAGAVVEARVLLPSGMRFAIYRDPRTKDVARLEV